MKRSVMFAIGCGVAAVACEPAAAANAWGGAYCMGDREGRLDCGFTTLAQCQASASGTGAGCYAAPPSLLQQQGAAEPAQSGRARAGRSER